MKSRFIDTNIFLEVAIRKGKRSDRCLEFLENKKNKLWTTILVISEIEWVLRSFYEVEKRKIVDFLMRIFALKNLEIEDKKLLLEALEIYEKKGVDWTDCINVVLAKKKGIEKFVSFDKDFEKMGFGKRVEV